MIKRLLKAYYRWNAEAWRSELDYWEGIESKAILRQAECRQKINLCLQKPNEIDYPLPRVIRN